MKKSITPYARKALYYETDQMGVVHHSNYIRWFEEARMDFLNKAGFPYKKMEDIGVMIPILSVTCEYKRFVRFDEEVLIYTKVDSFNGVKLNMSYQIINKQTQELCNIGYSTHCFLDSDKKILKLKRDFPDIYNLFADYVEE